MGIGQDRHLDSFKDYYGNTPRIGDEFIRDFRENSTYVVKGIHVEGISGSEYYYIYKLIFNSKGSNYPSTMSRDSFKNCIILNNFKSIQIK